MGSRRALGTLFILFSGVGGAFACADSEPADVPEYGQANGLKNSPLPPNGVPASSSSGGSSGSSSGSSSGGGTGDGGGVKPTVTLACVTAGGTVVDGGPCAESWSQTLWPQMKAGGAWGCGGPSPCHGGTTVPPLGVSASADYATLANFTTINTLPYVNPCSTDPTKSTFVCNTATTGTCGGQAMPLAGGAGIMTDAGLAQIAAWVACGAPQN